MDAFGYRLTKTVEVLSCRTAEGKEPDTLQPCVLLCLKLDDAGGVPELVVTMPLETAEQMAAELLGSANRAREKHWDPDT